MEKFLWWSVEATLLSLQAEFEPPQLATVLNDAEAQGMEVFAIFSPKPSRAVVVCRRPVEKPLLKPAPKKRAKK